MKRCWDTKRLTCLLLGALVFACAFFVACGEEPAVQESSEPVSEESVETALVPSLGEADYSGKVLRVLTTGEAYPFGWQTFGAEENDEAEPVNEACLARDALLEREYGFTIEAEFTNEWAAFSDRVSADYMAGTVNYDVACTGLMTMATIASEGFLKDLNHLEGSHLDLTAPWWDVAANEDMTIGHKLYFTTGDILYMDDEYTCCIFYNKGMAKDHQLDDPSEIALDNEWTLDVMYEMIKAVAAENDDGVMNVSGNDVWGCVSDAFDLYSLVVSCDCPQVEKDENDYPVMAMMNEKNVNAWLKAFDMFMDHDRYAYTEMFYAWNDPNAEQVRDQFTNGKSLFTVSLIASVNKEKFREANISYGILPMPKYDVDQPRYTTMVNPYRFYVLGIMQNCQDVDFVTFALESMAYLNREMVTPEYYDRTLKNKRFPDDDDSPEMLDILFSNRLVDISVAFNWDDCIQYYNQTIWNGSTELASTIESKLPQFNAAMQETIDYFAALEN